MNGAPGADVSFDDLFPPEGPPAAPPQAVQGTQPPQAPQADQVFLKAGDSVYKTAEEAAKGLEYKDQLVARYRAFLTEQGFDPNDPRPAVRQESQAPAPAAQSQYKYLGNGKKYYQALSDAVQRRDEAAYEQVQHEYQTEVVQSVLAPYAPLMAESARQRAIRQVSTEIPDFQAFIGSADFKRTVDSIPLYKEMLQIGESNPQAAERLPEVYKSLYLINQGLNRQASQTQAAPVAAPVQNPPTTRTMNTSTLTPPAPGPNPQDWTTNREARKALIQDQQARGIGDRNWGDLGL
jgi:hypothetical protein